MPAPINKLHGLDEYGVNITQDKLEDVCFRSVECPRTSPPFFHSRRGISTTASRAAALGKILASGGGTTSTRGGPDWVNSTSGLGPPPGVFLLASL